MAAKQRNSLKNKMSSIRMKVSLFCTSFIMIAILVNFYFMINVNKDSITSNAEVTMQELAASYSQSLSDSVKKANEATFFIMGSQAVSDLVASDGADSLAAVEELVTMLQNSNTTHEEISIVNAKGKILYSSNSELIGSDLSGTEYFKEMVSSGLSTQGDVFLSDATGEAFVPFAIPLRPMQMNNTENTEAIAAMETPGDPQATPVEEFTGAIITNVKVSAFQSNLTNISIGNTDTGYAFILDSKGNFIYHPDSSQIGTAADVPEIAEVVSQSMEGTLPETKIITFDFNNIKKYAGYSILADNGWFLFIVANETEILSSLETVVKQSISTSIILIIILSVLAYLFTGTITSPIMKITRLINKTSELDFTEDLTFNKLTHRKDETGEMSRAIMKMRSVLNTMIMHISDVSGKLSASSDNLNQISISVNEQASDNSATAEELSASMEETAATTEQIYSSIELIGNNSKEINDNVSLGTKLAADLMKRAEDHKTATQEAIKTTGQVFEEVKARTDAAIEQSKAVNKINIMTKTIKEIASQTSLLALNASIEAARAGEAGSGFSIVASEIGILAEQSSRTVNNINEIVTEVHQAVENLTASLTQTLNFLEKNVQADYSKFVDDSESYNADARTMNETMESIHRQIELLNTNVLGISDSIAEINQMVNEASMGVSDVAEKNTNIVAITSNTQKLTKENTEYADGLKEIVDKFKL